MTTFASENNKAVDDQTVVLENTSNADADIMPLASGSVQLGANDQYVEVAYRLSASDWTFSFNVRDFKPADYQVDIEMVNRAGQIVWQEADCLGTSEFGRTFGCGSNVCRIYLRIIPRNKWLFPAGPKNFTVEYAYT